MTRNPSNLQSWLHFCIMTARESALVIFLIFCVFFGDCAKNDSIREKKLFSIFNVVNFDNVQCKGTIKQADEFGTCFTADECTTKGGFSIGNCASGFGVCCQFEVSTCGSNVNENCSYVTNEGFPNTFQSSQDCVYRVQNQRPIICQLRLDFLDFDLEKTAGVCTDGLTIDGPTRRDPAQVCGRLAGQHIYVETGRSGTPTTFTFDTSNDDSRWRIKVTYYECSNLRRSPEGCLQYFTGVSGEFQSFSFNDGDTSILLNTDYVICFRRERGFCQIDYSVQPNDGMEFVLGAAGTQNGGAVADQNKAVYLEISGSSSELYSGQTFADVVPTTSTSSQTTNGVVRANGPTFRIGVLSTQSTVMATNAAMGFSLTYNQVAC